jgi:hypothetical protein
MAVFLPREGLAELAAVEQSRNDGVRRRRKQIAAAAR